MGTSSAVVQELREVLMEWLVLYGDSKRPWHELLEMVDRKDTLVPPDVLNENYFDHRQGFIQITEKGKQWLLNQPSTS